MKRSSCGGAFAIGALAATWAFSATAQTVTGGHTATAGFLLLMTERFEFTVAQLPALGAHLLTLPQTIGGRTALLLVGIVAAGLMAEFVARLILSRARVSAFDRNGQQDAIARLRACAVPRRAGAAGIGCRRPPRPGVSRPVGQPWLAARPDGAARARLLARLQPGVSRFSAPANWRRDASPRSTTVRRIDCWSLWTSWSCCRCWAVSRRAPSRRPARTAR